MKIQHKIIEQNEEDFGCRHPLLDSVDQNEPLKARKFKDLWGATQQSEQSKHQQEKPDCLSGCEASCYHNQKPWEGLFL